MSAEDRMAAEQMTDSNSPAGGFNGRVSVGSGRTRVELLAEALGEDCLLRITGGRAHVGAVATCGHGQVQLSVVGSHKEGPLAQVCAEQWSLLTGRVCVAVVGIHQDRATGQEIDGIVENVRRGLEILTIRFRKVHHAE